MRPNTLANLSALNSKLSGLTCQVFMWTDGVLLTFNKTNKNDNNNIIIICPPSPSNCTSFEYF